MKKTILILSVLGMSAIQASNAAVNNLSNPTVTNSSTRTITYNANDGNHTHVSSNDEINQTIDSLSANTNKKENTKNKSGNVHILKIKTGVTLLTNNSRRAGNFDKFTQTVKSTSYRSSPNKSNVDYEEKSDSSTYAKSAYDALR